jgi:heme oxygenase
VSSSPVLEALRLSTAARHHWIEAESGVEERLRDGAARPVVMRRFLDLHRGAEARSAPWYSALRALGYSPEARSPLIVAGLLELGDAAHPGAPAAGGGSFGEAIGWIYVTEGSMLGGRVMRRSMIADGIGLEGLGFLDPWGDATGTRWRAFLRAMEDACASGQAAQVDVLKGGCDAFDLACALLVPTRPTECLA